jgi:hypothetical protein
LVCCNHPFAARAAGWRQQGKKPKDSRVRGAARFCRIAYPVVAGRLPVRHPAAQERHSVLHQRTAFRTDHDSPAPTLLRERQAASEQLPPTDYRAEAQPLHQELQTILNSGRRGPQRRGDLLPLVLARLGVAAVQSNESGARDLP